jgi:hypothetical protein
MLRKHQPKRLGLIWLAAVAAMLAAGAVGAMSASAALPEVLWCMTTATGSYSSVENCEKLVSGGSGWEWGAEPLSGEAVTFDTKGLKALLLTMTGGLDIECTAYEGSSAVSLSGGNQLFSGSAKMTGCKEVGGFNGACNSTEPPGVSGEIITKELNGSLVYLKAGKALPVGLLLTPTTGTVFTTLSCVGGIVKENVEGSIIGEVLSPVNVTAVTGKVLYAENEVTKKQVWIKVEEGAETFELLAFGEKALEITESTSELLIGGTALTFMVEA